MTLSRKSSGKSDVKQIGIRFEEKHSLPYLRVQTDSKVSEIENSFRDKSFRNFLRRNESIKEKHKSKKHIL